ncbi:MAG: hypothetical protein H7343_05830 [Undibacterium sp.]|nr:hypothetical protein [Opitutaceae bacterium]
MSLVRDAAQKIARGKRLVAAFQPARSKSPRRFRAAADFAQQTPADFAHPIYRGAKPP